MRLFCIVISAVAFIQVVGNGLTCGFRAVTCGVAVNCLRILVLGKIDDGFLYFFRCGNTGVTDGEVQYIFGTYNFCTFVAKSCSSG